MPDDVGTHKTIYFAYGSNLWIDQMKRRCPEHKYIGPGILHDWCWIINQRGYANVVPSSGDYVYGSVYEISPKDEEALDVCEGFPNIYDKRIIPIRLKVTTSPSNDETTAKRTIDTMVYIDFTSTNRDVPKTEYIHRINMGVKDALQSGIPKSYIDTYIRPFIPPE